MYEPLADVNDCSITSGHQPSRASGSGSPAKLGPHGKGRNILKLGSEDPTSPLTTPSTSPCKRIFTKMSPDPVPSGSKGKAKAVIEEESAGEEDDEVEVEPEAEEDDEEEVAVKPTQGRPRKAILLDAAKRLKKL
ncbi:hypothetical protein PtB15_9B429 [Puccinia triticina]|nr:hypothetical protein PtB15_9B429 [Puccinia triticina]